MLKFLWVIFRNNLPIETEKKVLSICEAQVQENIIPNEVLVHVSEQVSFGLSNPRTMFMYLITVYSLVP